jgi:hypothetical protein
MVAEVFPMVEKESVSFWKTSAPPALVFLFEASNVLAYRVIKIASYFLSSTVREDTTYFFHCI